MDKRKSQSQGHFQKGKAKMHTHSSKKRVNPKKQFKGSKQEGEGFAEKRKKKMHYEYMKLLKKEMRQRNLESQGSIIDAEEMVGNGAKKTEPRNYKVQHKHQGKQHMFSEAQKQFQVKKESQLKLKKENLLRLEEQKKAIDQYRSKRKKKHLMLCKKTHKGQPIMKHQINYLLEKIQADIVRS
ncbi:thyroid transcription factor 1-associated protein 26 homolog [Haliotis asinina]|uniref:thyroid transcription factor 1-associated protein 26 homolog n=1 Tax=Haliotis asinina TaxID=109174 RepID=UPI0035327892